MITSISGLVGTSLQWSLCSGPMLLYVISCYSGGIKSPKSMKDKLPGDSPKPHPSIDSTSSDIGSPCSDITGFSSDHATPNSPAVLKTEDCGGKDSPLLGCNNNAVTPDGDKLDTSGNDDTFPPALIQKTSVLVNPTNVVAPSPAANNNKYSPAVTANNMFLPPSGMSNYSAAPRGYYEGDMWGIPPYDLGTYPPSMPYPMGSSATSPAGVMNNFNFSQTPSYPHTIGYTGKPSATSPWQPGGSYSPHHMMSPTTPNSNYGNSNNYSPGGSPYAAPSLPPVMISPLLSRSNTNGLF